MKMDSVPEGLMKWHKFVSEQDMQALSEAVADDVLFRSPVLWKPKEGKATAILHMRSVVRVLEDFVYHRSPGRTERVALARGGMYPKGRTMRR